VLYALIAFFLMGVWPVVFAWPVHPAVDAQLARVVLAAPPFYLGYLVMAFIALDWFINRADGQIIKQELFSLWRGLVSHLRLSLSRRTSPMQTTPQSPRSRFVKFLEKLALAGLSLALAIVLFQYPSGGEAAAVQAWQALLIKAVVLPGATLFAFWFVFVVLIGGAVVEHRRKQQAEKNQ
jgi:hypothetical protein